MCFVMVICYLLYDNVTQFADDFEKSWLLLSDIYIQVSNMYLHQASTHTNYDM